MVEQWFTLEIFLKYGTTSSSECIEQHVTEIWEDLNLPFAVLTIVLKLRNSWLTNASCLFASHKMADCYAFFKNVFTDFFLEGEEERGR